MVKVFREIWPQNLTRMWQCGNSWLCSWICPRSQSIWQTTLCDDIFFEVYLLNMDVILTLSIKFRLSWDSNTVDCRQVAELEKVLSDRQNIRSLARKIIMLSDQSKKQLKASIRVKKTNKTSTTTSRSSPQGLVYYWQVAWPTFFSNRCAKV